MRINDWFFFLVRVGEIGSLRMHDIHLDKDDEDETAIAIYIKPSKTDQYNLGAFKTLKSGPGEVCPVKMWDTYMTTVDYQPGSARRIFAPNLRVRLAVFLRMIGSPKWNSRKKNRKPFTT